MLKGFVYSNLFVALVLSGLSLSSYAQFDQLALHWYVPVSVFLGSFVLYAFHRLYKIDFIPMHQLAERHQWVLAHAIPMKYAMSFAVFILMLILPNFDADTIVWLVPAGIVSIGYTIPIIPYQKGWRRFRDIPLTKPMIIALVVSYLTLAFPHFEQLGVRSLFEPVFLHAFVERFLFLLAVTLPFDMRDIRNDKDSGIQTLGTHFGFENARIVGYWVLLAWVGSIVMRYVIFGAESVFLVAAACMLLYLLIAYWRLRVAWADMKYTMVFEGAIVLYALSYAFSFVFQTVA
ncbi:MAG: hypothetical protein RLP15_00850 [Cryomorphaceae bacterium]